MTRPATTAATRRWGAIPLSFAIAGLLLAACGSDNKSNTASSTSVSTSSSGPQALVGVFKIDPGTCSAAGVTAGSYFRMVQAGGTAAAGPFVPNGDSPCGDKSWNPLLPGTDGGLRTGAYQPQADPAFDAAGNATVKSIAQPVKFFAVNFGVSTNEKDPASGAATKKPAITTDGGKLTGDLDAFAAAWNKQQFNQGGPKPDGSTSGNTTAPSGTYDPATGKYTLEWTSQISGGPFDNFTGVWHLEGTFQAG